MKYNNLYLLLDDDGQYTGEIDACPGTIKYFKELEIIKRKKDSRFDFTVIKKSVDFWKDKLHPFKFSSLTDQDFNNALKLRERALRNGLINPRMVFAPSLGVVYKKFLSDNGLSVSEVFERFEKNEYIEDKDVVKKITEQGHERKLVNFVKNKISDFRFFCPIRSAENRECKWKNASQKGFLCAPSDVSTILVFAEYTRHWETNSCDCSPYENDLYVPEIWDVMWLVSHIMIQGLDSITNPCLFLDPGFNLWFKINRCIGKGLRLHRTRIHDIFDIYGGNFLKIMEPY